MSKDVASQESNHVAGWEILHVFELYAIDMSGEFYPESFDIAEAMAYQEYANPKNVGDCMEVLSSVKYVQVGANKLNHEASKIIPPGREGVSIVFENPFYPGDPDHAIVVYALFDEDEEEKLRLHLVTAGCEASYMMVYKKPCCPDLSYVVDLKAGDFNRLFKLHDSPEGTMPGHKNLFCDVKTDDQDNAIQVPKIQQGLTDSEVQQLIQEGKLSDPSQNLQNEIEHQFLHAKGEDHHCHKYTFTPPPRQPV